MKLGILGGMGPLATVNFYKRLVEKTPAKNDQEHIDTLILSHASMPDRTEVIEGGSSLELIGAVKSDLKIFEAANCEFIAIPCNTFHYFYDEVIKYTDIEVLNMVRAAVAVAEEIFKAGARIAVLGTKGTIGSKVYEREIDKTSLINVELEDEIQNVLMNAIYDVKATNVLKQPEVDDVIEKLFEDGRVDGLILACTELSIIDYQNKYGDRTIDAMDELVNLCIKKCI